MTWFCIALGPTATVLAYELHKLGMQSVDIGHIDVEYSWMKMQTNVKCIVPGRYVNEAHGGDEVEDCNNAKYNEEIIQVIK